MPTLEPPPRRKPKAIRHPQSAIRNKFPHASRVHAYAQAVVDGAITAGHLVRLACARHLADLAAASQPGAALVWRPEKAEAFIIFCEQCLFLSPEKPLLLDGWQVFAGGSLFGWYQADGYRRFHTAYLEIGKGNGKALALDTALPTPAGWTTMGAVKPGDTLFDERGQPCKVLAAHPIQFGNPCYRVRFSCGGEIVADAEHLWRTWPLRSGGRKGPKPAAAPRRGRAQIFTTRQLAATLRLPQSTSRHPQARWNHRIEIAPALSLGEADLPLPPYALGAWLGDGNSADARLTCTEPGILDLLRAEGVEPSRRASCGRAARYQLAWGAAGHFQRTLRRLALLGNKHVPACYVRASIGQRFALLRGLMDTDGHVSRVNSGQCEYATTHAGLADGVSDLLRTLGYKVHVYPGIARLYGRPIGPKWRLVFTAYADDPVFGLPRKQGLLRLRAKSRPLSRSRQVIACDEIPSVPVRCIAVDSPSRLFLAGRHLVPTHNTPFAAAVGLYGLLMDGEQAPEVYSAATAHEQAAICFKDARMIVESSPELARRIEVQVGSLTVASTYGVFRPLSAEHRGLDGKRVHIGVIDELHEHRDDLVVDKLAAGTKSRRNALILEITNSGVGRETVCWRHHETSVAILEGRAKNESWFAYVCTLDPCPACTAAGKLQPDAKCPHCDDWRDPATWIKSNPSLDVILPRAYLEKQVGDASSMVSKENLVRRLNFCQWTEQANRWLSLAAWDQCAGPLDFRALAASLVGKPCKVALDAATVGDFSALVLMFHAGEKYQVLPYFFIPADNLPERVRKTGLRFDLWAKDGLIDLTPGNQTDYAWIEKKLLALGALFTIEEIAFDPYNLTDLMARLQGHGFNVVPVRQGFLTLSAPMKEFERDVLSHRLQHAGHPVLRWMAGNVTTAEDPAGNIKYDKEKSSEKIDGIAACVMARDRWLRRDPAGTGEPGVFFL